jgi:hypothetical protein
VPKITVEASDLLKVMDAMWKADRFLGWRDNMNAAVHLASDAEVRWSPLTSLVHTQAQRLHDILKAAGEL